MQGKRGQNTVGEIIYNFLMVQTVPGGASRGCDALRAIVKDLAKSSGTGQQKRTH